MSISAALLAHEALRSAPDLVGHESLDVAAEPGDLLRRRTENADGFVGEEGLDPGETVVHRAI
jgi:hypothetical protein